MIKFLPLIDVCEEIVDCPHESPKWLCKGVPVIRNFNLIDGAFDLSEQYFVDEETYKKRIKRIEPKGGDIIFSREAPIGNCAIVPENFKCCLGQRLVLLRANKKICSPQYLLAMLQSSYVKKQIAQVSKSGSIVSNFAIGDLKKLTIPIIDNQDDVANTSKLLLDILRNSREIKKIINERNMMLYQYWFMQFNFPDNTGNPYASTGGRLEWNAVLKRNIPAGWDVSTLGDIIVENPKSNIMVGEAKSTSGKIPFFTSGIDVHRVNNHLVDGMNCFLNTGGNADIKYYFGKASYSTDTWCITAKDNMAYYLPFILESLRPFMNVVYFQGTGLKHLQKDLLKKYPICIPPKNILDTFANKVISSFMLLGKNELKNDIVQELKNEILPLLMNEQVYCS